MLLIGTRQTSGLVEKDVRYFDRDAFDVDVLRLVRWYNARGFYRAKVTGVDEQVDGKGRVKVVVHVEEGVRAIVRSIDFDGADALTAAETQKLRDSIADDFATFAFPDRI